MTRTLSLLLALFIARVFGQILVVTVQPRWLPPMKDWYSGLLPYRFLLPAQIAIIALMIFMIRQRPAPNRPVAIGVLIFAAVYAASMVIRFVILRRRHPDYRWYEGGMIPIVFHWVLAAFLFIWSGSRL